MTHPNPPTSKARFLREGDYHFTHAFYDTINIMGGQTVLEFVPTSPVEIHRHLMAGLRRAIIINMVANLLLFRHEEHIEKAFGISYRTLQRMKAEPKKVLTPDQSSRAWKFASVLAKAAGVFGSLDDAEKWLTEPAIGLDYTAPIDLLETPIGAEAVERYLLQIDSGVYV